MTSLLIFSSIRANRNTRFLHSKYFLLTENNRKSRSKLASQSKHETYYMLKPYKMLSLKELIRTLSSELMGNVIKIRDVNTCFLANWFLAVENRFSETGLRFY